MIDLLLQALKDILVGLIIAVGGFYIGFKYVLPKVSRDMAISTANAILEHPKVKPHLEKLKKLEPLLDKAKDLDLQELVDLAAQIRVFIQLQTNNTAEPPPPKTKPPTK